MKLELPLIDESDLFDARTPEDVADIVLDEIDVLGVETENLSVISYLVNDDRGPADFQAWRERQVQRLPDKHQAELVAQVSLPMFLDRFKQRCRDKAGVARGGGYMMMRRGYAAYGLSPDEFKEFIRSEMYREVRRFCLVNPDIRASFEFRRAMSFLDNDAHGWIAREIRQFSSGEVGERPRDLTPRDLGIGRTGEGIDRRRNRGQLPEKGENDEI